MAEPTEPPPGFDPNEYDWISPDLYYNYDYSTYNGLSVAQVVIVALLAITWYKVLEWSVGKLLDSRKRKDKVKGHKKKPPEKVLPTERFVPHVPTTLRWPVVDNIVHRLDCEVLINENTEFQYFTASTIDLAKRTVKEMEPTLEACGKCRPFEQGVVVP